jgi:divalent metal cation (Fe/Co/Zn/Cd) transporter
VSDGVWLALGAAAWAVFAYVVGYTQARRRARRINIIILAEDHEDHRPSGVTSAEARGPLNGGARKEDHQGPAERGGQG